MKSATYRQAQQVLKFVGQQDLSGKQLQQLLVSGLFTDILEAAATDGFPTLHRDTVRVALGLPKLTPDPSVTELGELTVGEKATTEEMVRAGEYNYANENITTANFPITRRGPRKLYLVHFKKDMESEQVEAAVAAMGDKELAKTEDLLAVGLHPKHKELQREFPTICLGSSAVLDGDRHVPCLGRWGDGRELDLDYYDSRWDDYCRFLLAGSPSPDVSEGHSKPRLAGQVAAWVCTKASLFLSPTL
ncbi:MAG: hypothetical protein WEA04_02930 [Candidatus Andersenbacteria bacterium]